MISSSIEQTVILKSVNLSSFFFFHKTSNCRNVCEYGFFFTKIELCKARSMSFEKTLMRFFHGILIFIYNSYKVFNQCQLLPINLKNYFSPIAQGSNECDRQVDSPLLRFVHIKTFMAAKEELLKSNKEIKSWRSEKQWGHLLNQQVKHWTLLIRDDRSYKVGSEPYRVI